MLYVAHGPDHALTNHLQAVADRAARCAPAGAQPWAHQAGLWHDLGKFRPGFQRYIRECQRRRKSDPPLPRNAEVEMTHPLLSGMDGGTLQCVVSGRPPQSVRV